MCLTKKTLHQFLILTLFTCVCVTSHAEEDTVVVSLTENGQPALITGDLGVLPVAIETQSQTLNAPATRMKIINDPLSAAAANFMASFVEDNYVTNGTETLVPGDIDSDGHGTSHIKFQQKINGMNVYGANLIAHIRTADSTIYAVNGEFITDDNLASTATLAASPALHAALAANQISDYEIRSQGSQLAYVVTPDGSTAVLAWRTLVAYQTAQHSTVDYVYVDATNGELVTMHPTVHPIRNVRTYDGNNRTSLPGTLDCVNEENCSDAVAQEAHDNAKATYDYYQAKFGRDSLNDNGFTLTSTVHYGSTSQDRNNAFWNGSQMAYGDGDGNIFNPLGGAFDVVAHEFTHGITTFESNLIYQNESGAINEALSDIFGAAAEAWRDGNISADTWLLGEDVYTPNTPGDALRYMNDPTEDNSSMDYYPERFVGSADNGGVHWNSGIANLAFYLLVEGGSHPRDKTSFVVPAIGLEKAEQIFYRAQTTYLTPSSNFQAARNATALAAQDLYGDEEVEAIQLAWCAVGVNGCNVGGNNGTELENGVAANNLSGATGSTAFWTFEIPADATNLEVKISGGSGDADLYVRRGSAPTTSSYDCRPYQNGNNETCTFATPASGTWHVMIRGFSSYSSLTLVASWTEPDPGPGPVPADDELLNDIPRTGLSGAAASLQYYTINIPEGANNLVISMSGGSGDADLYVRRGAQPTTSVYDCRPFVGGNTENCSFDTPAAGVWHVMIRGYSAFSGTSIRASWDENSTPEPEPCTPGTSTSANLTGTTGSTKSFSIEVPACANNLSVKISGGSGDADLYVRANSAPTTSSYDCRPYLNGNNETCNFNEAGGKTWYINIRAFSNYSGVTLELNYSE